MLQFYDMLYFDMYLHSRLPTALASVLPFTDSPHSTSMARGRTRILEQRRGLPPTYY